MFHLNRLFAFLLIRHDKNQLQKLNSVSFKFPEVFYRGVPTHHKIHVPATNQYLYSNYYYILRSILLYTIGRESTREELKSSRNKNARHEP